MSILNKIFYLLIISNLFILTSKGEIVISLKEAPEKALNLADMDYKKERLIEKLAKIDTKTPSQISNKLLKNKFKKNLHPKTSGFMAIYAGYIDYSNNGIISFPLRHTAPKLYLVITPRIKLIGVKGNTISHREFFSPKTNPTEIYLYEKKEDKNKQLYWEVTKQDIPQNNKINPLSVVIFTKPKNLYVSLGDFMTNDNKQIILPDIYVVGNVDNTAILLNSIDTRRFFEPIQTEQGKTSDILFRKIITNM